MKIHRIELNNFKGVGHISHSFQPNAINVIESDNETGKSSVREALNLILREKDKARTQAIRDIQPINNTSAPKVLLDASHEGVRFTVSKQWLKNQSTELSIVGDSHVLYGEDAHRHLREVVLATVNWDLWDAVNREQAGSLTPPSYNPASLDTSTNQKILAEAKKNWRVHWTPKRANATESRQRAERRFMDAKAQLCHIKEIYTGQQNKRLQLDTIQKEIKQLSQALQDAENTLEVLALDSKELSAKEYELSLAQADLKAALATQESVNQQAFKRNNLVDAVAIARAHLETLVVSKDRRPWWRVWEVLCILAGWLLPFVKARQTKRKLAILDAEKRLQQAQTNLSGMPSETDVEKQAQDAKTNAEKCTARVENVKSSLSALGCREEVQPKLDTAREIYNCVESDYTQSLAKRTQLVGALKERDLDDVDNKLEAAQNEYQSAKSEHERIEKEADAIHLLCQTLLRHRKGALGKYRESIKEQIDELGRMVMGPTFSVDVDESLTIISRSLNAITLPPARLSIGAQEQLATLSRLACAMLGEGVPVILDDVLGWSDPDRLFGMNRAIRHASQRCQIIIMTWHARTIPKGIINLNPPLDTNADLLKIYP